MKPFGQDNKHQFIGISGTFAAGKDTAGEYLRITRGLLHMSTGDILRAEATRRGLDHKRQTLIDISIELRNQGSGYDTLILMCVNEWLAKQNEYSGGLAISGIRIIGEAKVIQKLGGKLFFIDAPAELRYERLKHLVAKDTSNPKLKHIQNLDDFIESERYEREGQGGEDSPNLNKIKEIADAVIENSGAEEEFFRKIDSFIG